MRRGDTERECLGDRDLDLDRVAERGLAERCGVREGACCALLGDRVRERSREMLRERDRDMVRRGDGLRKGMA